MLGSMPSPAVSHALALSVLFACTAGDREAPAPAGAPAPAPVSAAAPVSSEPGSPASAGAPTASTAPITGAPASTAAPADPGAGASASDLARPAAPPEPPAGAPVASDPPEDVFARLARLRPDLESACAARPELACTRTGDLDGDGKPDEIALVRPRGGEPIGLAIAWGRGGGEVLGAGERGLVWRETIDESTRTAAIPIDFDWLARWDVWRADGPVGKRRGLRDARGRRFTLKGVVGDGLLLDGGDSATVAYWDGQRWRHEYLGF